MARTIRNRNITSTARDIRVTRPMGTSTAANRKALQRNQKRKSSGGSGG